MPTKRSKQTPKPHSKKEPVAKTAPAAATTAPVQKTGGNTLLIILLIVISLFAGYNFAKVKNLENGTAAGGAANNQAAAQVQPTRPTELKIKKPDLQNEHVRGNTNARYVWVEYSDLECPFCKAIHPSMQKLVEDNKDIAWVFRHFPLPFHPKAEPSAEASECVAEQGGNEGFWKFVDAVYDKMPDIDPSSYPDLVGQLGYDSSAFKNCVDSKKYEKLVKDETTEGSNAGVQATPTGVIYDMKTGKTLLVEGALPYDQLKQQLDTFISQNK